MRQQAEKGVRSLLPERPEGCCAQKAPDPFFRSAFTLIEMMVVVGIIVVLVSITLPAIGPMLASNKEAQVFNTLGGLLINAQATASQTATCVGLRVERAFKTNDVGLMYDQNGVLSTQAGFDATKPAWLDYQRVRFVTLAAYKDQVFSQTKDTKVFDLPKDYWLAPSYSLGFASLAETNLWVSPTYVGKQAVANVNILENFYIIFNPQGELIYYPIGGIVYKDQTQQYLDGGLPYSPYITHPTTPSARSVLVYDRRQWNEIPFENHASRFNALSTARPININRITGTVVEEKTQ